MKLDPSFAHHRKITRDQDSGKLFARRPRSSRTYDVIVAATLLALLVVAIVTPAPLSNEITDSNVDRQSLCCVCDRRRRDPWLKHWTGVVAVLQSSQR